MTNFNLKKESILWILLIIPFIYLSLVWNLLPEVVPIHFAANGKPDGWGSKSMELIAPGINIFVYLLLLSKTVWSKNESEFTKKNSYKVRLILTLVVFALTMFAIHAALLEVPFAVGVPAHSFVFCICHIIFNLCNSTLPL